MTPYQSPERRGRRARCRRRLVDIAIDSVLFAALVAALVWAWFQDPHA